MYKYPLHNKKDHLFVEVADQLWLLDTGAPSSFGDISQITLGDQDFSIASSYMGLNTEILVSYVNVTCQGLLGADVLNQFNWIFDLAEESVTLSTDTLEMQGIPIQMQEFMGIPIIPISVNGTGYKVFFDTGAKISYLDEQEIASFPEQEIIKDFYPGFGEFETQTYLVDIMLAETPLQVQCGSLPALLQMTLTMASTQGILGNSICGRAKVGYFPKRSLLCLQM